MTSKRVAQREVERPHEHCQGTVLTNCGRAFRTYRGPLGWHGPEDVQSWAGPVPFGAICNRSSVLAGCWHGPIPLWPLFVLLTAGCPLPCLLLSCLSQDTDTHKPRSEAAKPPRPLPLPLPRAGPLPSTIGTTWSLGPFTTTISLCGAWLLHVTNPKTWVRPPDGWVARCLQMPRPTCS